MNPGYGFGDYFVSPVSGGVYRLVIQNGDGSIQIWDSAANQPERRILRDYQVWREQLKSIQEVGAFRTVQEAGGVDTLRT